ncbi:hypothetical protein V7O62_12035 [Methanolobus sp. ZRKC2]|uniref:hypothetical protein n=1 Tax=Methanolobus sp. ZRKC2 TaxID=3125783 RepID=UPI0032481DCD
MRHKDKDYIVAGIPPSRLGVGRLMAYLVEQNQNNFCIIYPNIKYPESDLETLIRRVSYLEVFKQSFNYAYSKIINHFHFKNKIGSLKSRNVILVHPQTIGLENVTKIVENNNVFIYLMDCSFFCVKSYNHIEKSFQPCSLCIGGNYEFAKLNNCKPFPEKYKLSTNVHFLKMLQKSSSKITFLVQNYSQGDLVKKHFGEKTRVLKIGMFASDFIENSKNLKNKREIDEKYNFDFVYHGAVSEAKGLLYTLNIASKLNQFSFLIPAPYEKCKKIIDVQSFENGLENVTFLDMRWETGLKEYITNSKVILCPSLWSASIEGAVIKSFIFNGVVALVPAKYSFANDLPESIYCKLDDNSLDRAAEKLKELIENEVYRNCVQTNAQNWIYSFLDDNKHIIEKLKVACAKETYEE